MDEDGTYMTDKEALQLLRLLYRYVRFAGDQPSDDIKISELAEDLTSSQIEYSEESFQLAREIRECVL